MPSDCLPRIPEPSWPEPPSGLRLARNEVHIWRATLELPPAHLGFVRQLLDSDERARAERFVFEQHKNRYIVAHGFLRVILSSYLDCSPTEVAFIYDKLGKRWLFDSDRRGKSLTFNFAHSGTLAICGVTLQRVIGVDIEEMRADFAIDDVVRRFFSAKEARCFFSLPPSQQLQAFYDGWTRKEAIIKAIGAGLSLPLDQFDVTLAPGQPAALLETRWDTMEAARWSLRAIDVAPNYAASIAVEGSNWILQCWQASEAMLYRALE